MLGITLHAGQVEWLRAEGRVKVACCGRRWGKSYAESADLLYFAVMHAGSTQFLIAPTHDQTTVITRYLAQMARESRWLAPSITKVTQSPFFELTLDNGSSIHARSAAGGQHIRGHGADRLILDEAAYIADDAYAVLSPMLATSEHRQLVLISTPFGKNTFFDYYSRGEAGEPGYVSMHFPSSSSPLVDQEWLDAERRDKTALEFAVEYGAEFREDANAVFSRPLIQSCLRDGLPTDPDPTRRYVIGYDPAKYADRSGVVVLDVTETPWQVVAVRDISGRDYLVQAAEIARLSALYSNAHVLLDATSHDQMLEQLDQRDRVRATGFKFTNETKSELINGLVLAMERGELLLPHHHDLITELTYYRYELTAAGNVKLGAADRYHDDLVTALALAVWQAHRGDKMPFGWLREDPAFRDSVLGNPEETEEQRQARRTRDYLAAQGL